MFYRLLFLFTAIPFVELVLLLEVGKRIGLFPTLFIVVATGVAGAALARLQGFSVLRRLQQDVQEGRMPTDSLLDGILVLVGALLLLTPGFLTDAAGFSLLIPGLRRLYRVRLKAYLRRKFRFEQEYFAASDPDEF